jgi:putative addiction module antidote
MTVELKLRQLGNSVGAIIPKEVLARLNAREGDTLYLTESTDGAFRLTAHDPELAETMAIAEEGIRRYRNALRELAK